MKFPQSALAHALLDGKKGIEVGPSAHNPFGLDTISVGHETKGTVYEQEEVRLCGEYARLDFICEGDSLPFPDNYFDFVLCSHVLEHFHDLIKAVEEWLRVVKDRGLVFVIFPHKLRTFDKDKPRTKLEELLKRHELARADVPPPPEDHHTIWVTEDAVELCRHMGWHLLALQDIDDKVGNGFTFVIQK
jgi:SAM-dependent methyltransferase